jgi:APA family basic amino acid/polyamine antiporter
MEKADKRSKRYGCSDIFGLGEPGRSLGGDFEEYGMNLLRTPQNFYRRARVQHTLEIDELSGHAINVSSHTTAKTDDLKKELNWFDLTNIGIGIILGAGVFVTTGTVANGYAGGATLLSFAIAGLSAMLSALCYSEYAVDYPIAGGSFTFMLQTFGEFPGWIAASNIVFNYILANAAVARSFSGYFASLCDQSPDFFDVGARGYILDFWAFGLVLLLSVLLCWGIKETKMFNNVVTVLHVGVVIFIIIAGLTQSKASNFIAGGFAPFGARGVFNGASLLFFSYVGFDAIATTAEEVKNPARDIPIGMSLALIIVTTLYFLCSITLTLMLPYTLISPDAAFSQAFVDVGMKWASYIVAAGAIMGIVTGTMVGLLAVARSITALGREHFLPPVAAWVHHKTQTPIITTAVLGVVTALIALFTAFDDLLNLVSICTLFTFYLIANGILYRHWYHPGVNKPWLALGIMVYFTAISLALAIYYQLSFGWVGLAVPGILWFIGCCVIMFIPQAYKSPRYNVPLMPWVPAGSIILNVFLLSTIASPESQGGPGDLPYRQWGVFMGCAVAVYILYSLPSIVTANRIAGLKQGAGAQELAYMEDGSGEPKMGGPGFNNNASGFDNNGHGHGPALASGFNKGDNPHAPAIAPVTNY